MREVPDTAGEVETEEQPETKPSGISRRSFLRNVGGIAVATSVGTPAVLLAAAEPAAAATCSPAAPSTGQARRDAAYNIRLKAANDARNRPLAVHDCNSDEDRFPRPFASFGKGLPHDRLGEVDPVAYTALLAALRTGNNDAFEAIPLGGTRKLVNPQGAFMFGLEGGDAQDFALPAPPAFDSAQRAAEMVELYWAALTRDVPFAAYDTDPLIARAAADLSKMSDFRGPKIGTLVTPQTLFRGHTADDLTGPYVSQFLWKDIPYGHATVVQRYHGTPAGADHLTAYAAWLSVQRGDAVSSSPRDTTARYIRNGRDLAEYVHNDFSFQAGVNAALILLATPWTMDPGNPYLNSKTQDPFCSFGGPYVLDLVSRVSNAALRATWFQKWALHRTLRPEEFGGRVHNHLAKQQTYPIHPDLLVTSEVLGQLRPKQNTYLLPVAYPEGSPLHPSYPAGHAAIAGACVTVLKAFFNEAAPLPNPVVASADGLSLASYTGGTLKVGAELNKLAANVALGRDTAGVHYRSDSIQGLLLGEAVALRLLHEMRSTYSESFPGFFLTKFDGTVVAA